MTEQNFFNDESGAVTVDWVVLTAALVGLGLAVMTVVRGGVSDISNDISTALQDDGIIRVAFGAAATDALDALGIDAGRLAEDAQALQNDALGQEYALALAGDGSSVLGATAASGNLGSLSTALSGAQSAAGVDSDGNPNPIDWSSGVSADITGADGTVTTTTFTSEEDFNAAVTSNSATVQAAGILADEANQRGLSWNGTAFE